MDIDLQNFEGCKETPMCEAPDESDADGTMVLQPYNMIDNGGSVNGNESVYYKCKEPDYKLNDKVDFCFSKVRKILKCRFKLLSAKTVYIQNIISFSIIVLEK